MTSPKVLVTGATGFLGSRLVKLLVEEGHDVKVLARPSSSLGFLRGLPPGKVEVALGDITVGHTVFRALAGCDRMFHVAANFKMWDRRPATILDAAIVGTRETLAAAKARGLERVVVTSSTAAVGATAEPVDMDETFAFNRQESETYIVAKARAEAVAREFAAGGLPVVVTCPSGIFGPGDWKPTPSGEMVLTALRWRGPFGMPFTGGGINVVDVDDVARGHLLAMQKGRVGERYILGGENLRFDELFSLLGDLAGTTHAGVRTPRAGAMIGGALMETFARFFDFEPQLTYKMGRDFADSFVFVTSEKAERELGYTHRGAREAFARSIRWYLASGHLDEATVRRISRRAPPAST